ncbi:MAG: ribbon-helix-helix protein, CopG family [Thermoplasmata archaeon]
MGEATEPTVVTVKFPPELLARLDAEVQEEQRDRSFLIREFVDAGLRRRGKA